tara:strand:+ start:5986 stop:8172 length:2187 start_codon:yes stop_codon:yes gene_type:complete
MAEKIVSPGVFTNEVDQSFLPAAIADIGAALIGPTVKGPALIPTIVTSYSEFQQKFGDVFESGSNSYQYLTSHTAEQYLKSSGTLTVVRILDGTFGPASASSAIAGAVVGDSNASGSIHFDNVDTATGEITMGGVDFQFVDNTATFIDNQTSTLIFVNSGSSALNQAQVFVDTFNLYQSTHGLNYSASAAGGETASFVSTIGGSALNLTTGSGTFITGSSVAFGGSLVDIQGGTSTSTSGTSFTLTTHADGTIMNSLSDGDSTNNILPSGSVHNIRWEVPNVNNNKGTFTLLIRRGDDSVKRKQIIETFSGLSLDPKSTDYIGKRIGDQVQTVRSDENGKPFLQLSGSYPNKSKYVRVEVPENSRLTNYLDENGNVSTPSFSGSLPASGSGSVHGGFGGGEDGLIGFDAGGVQHGTATTIRPNFYENIDLQTQGYTPATLVDANGGSSYAEALDLLSNQDEYDINLILAPGIINEKHTAVASKIIDVCENRGDCFAIIDPVTYDKNVVDATGQAEGKDSNYAAMYWPWIQVPDNQLAGVNRWVPPSVVMGGIYAFNDKVAHPWYAPAGLNRGGIDVAIQAERKLTQADRDTLYDSNVNPIATFPGQGVTVFGQKTLQKKASALDRINVRRLLIKVKKFIASSSRFLLFEHNTAATRRRFLGIVNPYLENVQSQSGLNAFRVVMDETNNTPDTIDRNQLVGQLFLQPTRTAEFIVLDFTIQPTGAAFPE